MLRYVLAAQALRAFSATPATRSAYRKLGNFVGGRTRQKGLPTHYLRRANDNLRFIEKAGAIAHGMRVMEIGTGWAHWEALFARSFYDVEVILMDVWDNRQFEGFKRYVGEFLSRLTELDRPESELSRARTVLTGVLECQDFDAVYERLGFSYRLGVKEAYESVPDGSLDLIFSSDVLEHVPASAVPDMLSQHHRMLKANGVSAHQVVPGDHLRIYDRSVSGKNYIRFSEQTWQSFFENEVQYMNRIQLSEWVKLFTQAGFQVDHDVVSQVNVDDLTPAPEFQQLPPTDLPVTVFRIAGRKL